MISARFGHFLDKPLAPVARRITIHPNFLTLAGFFTTLLASFVITVNIHIGGILIICGGLFDMLDGIIARTNGKTSQFGAFLDSFLDRVSDATIFLALSWYLYNLNNISGAVISILTMIGALLISYARARAEGIGKKCTTGLMERPERIILVSFGCITGLILPVLLIMLVFTYVTVLQRIHSVWKTTL